MEKPVKNTTVLDPVDWFATEILRNPERADDLKDVLRQQMGVTRRRSEAPDPSDDTDDLWDNVPV